MTFFSGTGLRQPCKATFSVALVVMAVALPGLAPSESHAAPSAEVAKRCMKYSYIAYPYQRPGAVRMSGDRQAYFKDCMAKEGNVPQPVAPPKS